MHTHGGFYYEPILADQNYSCTDEIESEGGDVRRYHPEGSGNGSGVIGWQFLEMEHEVISPLNENSFEDVDDPEA